MATTFQASTPPPPSSIRTPTTPRFGGFDDNYQPYTPRKSARVSQRLRSAQTPPPQSLDYSRQANTPRTTRKSASTDSSLTSSPTSPQTASKRKAPRAPSTMGGRRVSGALNFESTAIAAASLNIPKPNMEPHRNTATIRNTGMLPTPDKTPRKAPNQVAPAITSIARNLFPIRPETVDEVMPSTKKKGKKYKGFTMDSFEAEDEDTPIQIYTDSHDRVPEADLSADNPFYGQDITTQAEPTKRASKRRKITVPGEGEKTIEELETREDGMVYTFRGKKMFRKFADIKDIGVVNDDDDEVEGDADEEPLTPRFVGRMTRSSIMPRLLFPSAQQISAKELRSHTTEDEEVETDIEETVNNGLSTPMDQLDDMTVTPTAPRFGPISPPTTRRTTRSKDVSSPAAPTSDDEPSTPKHGRGHGDNVSPFDAWPRSKNAKGTSKKRTGGSLFKGGEKKLRH